jgi:hypothetical protein
MATKEIDVMFKCFPPEACLSHFDERVVSHYRARPYYNNRPVSDFCSPGYEGPTCSLCINDGGDNRYYRSDSKCLRCSEGSYAALVALYVGVGSLVGLLLLLVHIKRKIDPKLVLMFVTTLQFLHLLHPGKRRFRVPRDTVFPLRGPKRENVTFLPRELPRTFEIYHFRPKRLVYHD